MTHKKKRLFRRFLLWATGSSWLSFPQLYKLRIAAHRHSFGVGRHSIIENGVWINCTHGIEGSIRIGNRALFARNVQIDYTGFVDVENDVCFSEGAVVRSHVYSVSQDRLSRVAETVTRTRVRFGAGCRIGGRVIISPTAREIGEGAIVAAGAEVSKPVEAFTIVARNPARLMRRIDEQAAEVAA